MTTPARFPAHSPILATLAALLLLVVAPLPLAGGRAAQAQSVPSEIDPESGKRADEAGIESDERGGVSSGRTNLPLPRFASLRASQVNVRTGPGVRYPIDWVFQRRNMPVEITAEFENWRKIRDDQGTEGWVHRQMLSGKRSLVVTGKELVLRRQADTGSPAVARLGSGVVAQVTECNGDWCRVEASGFRGWLPRAGTWGTKPGERVK
jgi:SH3-like domain-containing protein